MSRLVAEAAEEVHEDADVDKVRAATNQRLTQLPRQTRKLPT